ncbi:MULTISPECIES: alanine/glycine:cation symporter family protein [Oceanobacillus]|uniref:alanine/glycine:cation symporter family protein n=1 Tax=Oceanobacillus TaxID=182709 RepID=UPI00034693BA|nr:MULTISPECIES: alanine/glycine:cation symporter family protein [Oceanobacillus]MBT2600295.1 alanine:cation symporter family protein [Oceanobacillus sp. ISL-74]MBT2650453.1 alanine:cation symporter family protein [Oceanobacillus sp. ISL-73]MCT1578197.1 alanine:cation symporter family protein [Oceanobacillus kimchii]MCT2134375.1 alanine:cation symporter family protein [Oceanobacillus kimchii]
MLEVLQTIIDHVNNFLWEYVLIFVLIGLGLYYTIRTNFVQFRLFPEMFRVIGDKRSFDASGKKGTSSFQAFAISAASRVGTGNMAGVATAVALGGPGALFWMWIIALLGAASGFVESTLAQLYKEKDSNQYRGGPAYYIEKGMKKRWLGIVFAITITFTYGLVFNSVQSNTISLAFEGQFQIDPLWIAVILTTLVAVIIFGGLKSIANVSQVIVPFMAILYIVLALIILVMNIPAIPDMFALIFSNAFGIEQVAGGGFGAAIMMGIKRGLFSNEAGMGAAPNAAATAEVSHPVKQGLVQALGVFFDTILVCTATGFVILTAGGFAGSDDDGIQITQTAFTQTLGEWAGIFIAVAIFLFAFSSILGNYYYGENNIAYIRNTKIGLFIYRIAVLAMVVFGTLASFDMVWSLADVTMALLALINLYAITVLFKKANILLKDYVKQRKQGKDPVFYKDTLDDQTGIECWDREFHKNQ